MKHLLHLLIALFITTFLYAQAPQKMTYQAVVRDATFSLVQNKNVGIRISILQGTPTGTAVYSETHTASTNANGLVTIEVGGGSFPSTAFSSIDWSKGPYFIKTEVDPTGGSSYTISGSSQLLSVPYALYAATSGSGNASTTPVIDNLTSTSTTSALSANQGKVLKDLIDSSKTNSGSNSSSLTGDVSSTGTTTKIDKIQGNILMATTPQAGQALRYNGLYWTPTTESLTGDVTGPYTATKVTQLQTIPLAVTAPASGQIMKFNGVAWIPEYPYAGNVQLMPQIPGLYASTVQEALYQMKQQITIAAGGGLTSVYRDNTLTGSGISGSPLGLADGAVTFAKMDSLSNGTLIGRFSTGKGKPEAITIGNGLSLTGGTLTAAGTSSTPISGYSVLGNATGSSSLPKEVPITSLAPLLGVGNVSLTMPSSVFTPSPATTTSGSLSVNFVSQPKNTVFAGPITTSGVPSFRALDATDIPSSLPNVTSVGGMSIATNPALTLSSGSNKLTASGTAFVTGSNSGDQIASGVPYTNNAGSTTNVQSALSGLETAIAGKMTANTPITASGTTPQLVTYDAKGLVTGGIVPTTANIAASTDKNYVTDAQLTVLKNTSGTNSGDQTIQLTGDVTGTSTGAPATTINTTITKIDGSKVTYTNIAGSTTNVQNALSGLETQVGTNTTAIATKVTANSIPLVASTKTKISYDTKGLVTKGEDATATDIVFNPNTTGFTSDVTTVQRAIDKLNVTINSGGLNYTLPAASQTDLGGIKVGTGLSATTDGTLSTSGITPTSLKGITGSGNTGQVLTSDGSGGFAWSTGGGSTTVSTDNATLTGDGTASNQLKIATNGVQLNNLAKLTQPALIGAIAANGTPQEITLGSGLTLSSGTLSAGGTAGATGGDVTLAGQNYLSISGQTITAKPIDLSGTNVTGTLPASQVNLSSTIPGIPATSTTVQAALTDIANMKLDANTTSPTPSPSSKYSIVNYDTKGLVTSGKIPTLDDLGNVTATSNQLGDVLQWDGSKWINNLASGIPGSKITGSLPNANSINGIGIAPAATGGGFAITGGTPSTTLTVAGDGKITAGTTSVSGTNTGDISLVKKNGINYILLSNQTLTADQVDLGSDVKGTLAAGSFPALTGDVTTTAGSVTTTLSPTGVAANTYTSVTVDTKGRVTAGTNPTSLPSVTSIGGMTITTNPTFKLSDGTNNLTISGANTSVSGTNTGDLSLGSGNAPYLTLSGTGQILTASKIDLSNSNHVTGTLPAAQVSLPSTPGISGSNVKDALTDVGSKLTLKLDANTSSPNPYTGNLFSIVKYDTKGLVTGGAEATASNIGFDTKNVTFTSKTNVQGAIEDLQTSLQSQITTATGGGMTKVYSNASIFTGEGNGSGSPLDLKDNSITPVKLNVTGTQQDGSALTYSTSTSGFAWGGVPITSLTYAPSPAGGTLTTNSGSIPIGLVDGTNAGLMKPTDYAKLSTLSNYTLPIAGASTLGGIKVGTGLTINSGVLSTKTDLTYDSSTGIVTNSTGTGFSIPIGSTTVPSLMLTTDKAQLDGLSAALASKQTTALSTKANFAGDAASDSKYPSVLAVKSYVDSKIPATVGDMVLAGTQDVTGEKTFANYMLAMKGTSGVTTIGASTTADNTVTLPSGNGTLALKEDGLSQFAPISSSDFKNLILDATGTGALVFANSPTLGAVSATSITATGNISGNQLISTVTTGAPPFIVASTTPVTNLSIGGNAATATTATTATKVTVATANPGTVYPTWVTPATGGSVALNTSTSFNFNTTSGTLTVPNFAGNGSLLTSIPFSALTSFPGGSNYLASDGTWKALPAGGGTVTSVGLNMPGIFTFGTDPNPITASGTFNVSLATQAKNTVFAGPSTGSNAVPAFRQIVAADISGDLTQNAAGITGGSKGNLLYQTGSGTTAKLTNGSDGQVLTWDGTTALPLWKAPIISIGVSNGLTVNNATTTITAWPATIGISAGGIDFDRLKSIPSGSLLGNNGSGNAALSADQAKALLSLDKVKNIDQTNASNITSGTLSTSLFSPGSVPLSALQATGIATDKYLRGDGTWSSVSTTGNDPAMTVTPYSDKVQIQAGSGTAATIKAVDVTNTYAGLMIPSDKTKLNAYPTITNTPASGLVLTATGSSNASWQAPALTYTADGTNLVGKLQITGGNTVNITAVTPTTGTNLPGLMIPADKTKLDFYPASTTTSGLVLTTDGTGTAKWQAPSGGSGGGSGPEQYFATGTGIGAKDVLVRGWGSHITCAWSTQVMGSIGIDTPGYIITIPIGTSLAYCRINVTNTAMLQAIKNNPAGNNSFFLKIIDVQGQTNTSTDNLLMPAFSFVKFGATISIDRASDGNISVATDPIVNGELTLQLSDIIAIVDGVGSDGNGPGFSVSLTY